MATKLSLLIFVQVRIWQKREFTSENSNEDNLMKGLLQSVCSKQGMVRHREMTMVESHCHPDGYVVRGRIEFLDPSERTALEDFYAWGLCSWKEATSARGQVVKQDMSPSLLLRQILPPMKDKGKTYIKKARERKILLGAGQRQKKNGSGQGTWRITNEPRHYNYICRIIKQISPATDKHDVHTLHHPRHLF